MSSRTETQRNFPSRWPELPPSDIPFIFNCEKDAVGWISKNKLFFFSVASCVGSVPKIPQLLMCIGSSNGARRVERFRVAGTRFVGVGYMRSLGQLASANCDSVYVAVELVRIGRPEYDLLFQEGVESSRGRRPNSKLRIVDFVSTPAETAALSHWMLHPSEDDDPAEAVARDLLPADLRELCVNRDVASPSHPFAADFENVPRRLIPDADRAFTFIDLFAGVGGFRVAMQQENGHCVFASEIDRNACKTYRSNFGAQPYGDITKPETKAMIPARFDVLCAGFPCQAFSMAGLRKGFDDELQRGTLYKQIVEIARDHQPKAIFCENVKGLLSSADGEAFKTIKREIEGAGYHVVFENVLNSKDYGVPQNRERLYIVALRNDLYATAQNRGLAFPARPEAIPGQIARTIGDIREVGPVSKSYYLGQSYLDTLIRHRQRHAERKGSGFGYIVRTDDQIAATLMCGGMGRERNMLHDENQPDWNPTPHMKGGMNNQHLRFMTVREWARLQGFPDYFVPPESIQAGYKQFGNCVTVKTIRAVGRAILNLIAECEEVR